MNADLVRQIRRLQADADAILESLALRIGIETENGDLTTAARTQAFENLDRRGLARAVRAKQSEHFPRLDFEVDSLDSLHVAVGLLEALH